MKYAGFWIRLWALFLDTLLFAVPGLTLMFVVFPTDAVARAWIIGLQNVFFSAYWVYFQATTGRTLGKYLAGIKVVTTEGKKLTVSAALLRNMWFLFAAIKPAADICSLLSVPSVEFAEATERARGLALAATRPHWYVIALLILSLWWLVELIMLLRSDRKRSLHDLIGGTVVIHTQQDAQVASPASGRPAA